MIRPRADLLLPAVGARLGTGMRPGSGQVGAPPGTGMRVPGTGMRPPGTGANSQGVGMVTNVEINARPVTQQGMSGMKTAGQGPGRQVNNVHFSG